MACGHTTPPPETSQSPCGPFVHSHVKVNCRQERTWVLSPDMEGSRHIPQQDPLWGTAPFA